MNGTDIFIAILSAVMLFGGIYLNIVSRKLSAQYEDAHRPESTVKNTIKTRNK